MQNTYRLILLPRSVTDLPTLRRARATPSSISPFARSARPSSSRSSSSIISPNSSFKRPFTRSTLPRTSSLVHIPNLPARFWVQDSYLDERIRLKTQVGDGAESPWTLKPHAAGSGTEGVVSGPPGGDLLDDLLGNWEAHATLRIVDAAARHGQVAPARARLRVELLQRFGPLRGVEGAEIDARNGDELRAVFKLQALRLIDLFEGGVDRQPGERPYLLLGHRR